MKKVRMNKNGITLMSLIIYITIMFVILALIMRFTTYFTKNIRDVADTTFEEEFEKFNMYMLQETQKSRNYVAEVSEEHNSITFADGNVFEYKSGTKEIYYNEIKLCENVDSCIFSATDDEETTGKTTITVILTINGTTKEAKYVIDLPVSRLPDEYQEVEYIESTGTQYIVTDIDSSKYISAEIDTVFTELSSTSQILLACSSNAANWVGQNSQKYATGASNTINISSTTRKQLNVSFNSNNIELEIDGMITTRTGTHVNTDYYNIFGIGNSFLSKARIYNIKFMENNIIIGNFIPCYRRADGESGLYDLINNKFYTNQGTGVFNKGSNVDNKKTIIENESDYIIKRKNEIGLPYTYQQVEYIESKGTQYINTRIKYSSSNKYEIDYIIEQTQTVSGNALNGWNAGGSVGWRNGVWTDGENTFGNNISGKTSVKQVIYAGLDTNTQTYLSGNLLSTRSHASINTYAQNPFLLFADESKNSVTYYTKEKIYGVEIAVNDIKERNFIPCYCTRIVTDVNGNECSSGTIGLYDVVNDEFYTNSGTGTFGKGPDVY